jgi:hypothetical protein
MAIDLVQAGCGIAARLVLGQDVVSTSPVVRDGRDSAPLSRCRANGFRQFMIFLGTKGDNGR